jgi:hypothetical protein
MNEENQNQIQEQQPQLPLEAQQQAEKAPEVPLYSMYDLGDQVKKTLLALTRMADWDFILEYPLDPGKVARRARVPKEIVENVVGHLQVKRNLVKTVICGRPVLSLVPTEEWILYLQGLLTWKEERRLRAVIDKFTKNGWRAQVRPLFWLTREYTQAPSYLVFCPRLSDVPLGKN